LLGSVPKIDELPQEQITDPKSDYFEAFMSVRTSLSFSTDHGIPKSFVFVINTPGRRQVDFVDGVGDRQSPRMGRKVALIDADMRSPSLAEFFGIARNGRALELSFGQRGSAFAAARYADSSVSRSSRPDRRQPSATDLLASDRLSGLVQQLLRDFDHVILDAPPGARDGRTLPLIAQSVEGCIFVVQSEETAIRGINNAINRIRARPACRSSVRS
jgi:hypothetical protein